ncbi:MAG TPA: prepilin peptidase [Sphingomicrobium sp.]|nr:prepilin peptidase [Sphingomicrobium sp.]
MNSEFTNGLPWALMLLLALLLVRVVVTDLRSYTISNRLNLAIAALAPLYWWSIGLPVWPDVAMQVGLALTVFALFALLFAAGLMGGGDVKLAAALALWFAPTAMLNLVVIMSLAGGVLTLFVLMRHRRRKPAGRPQVPYGVAIAAGAWAILAERYLNHFA